MRDPVIDHERRAHSIKIPIVEDKQILILVRQSLDRMGRAFWKVPDVPYFEGINLVVTVFVDGRDKNTAGVDVAPFGLFAVS